MSPDPFLPLPLPVVAIGPCHVSDFVSPSTPFSFLVHGLMSPPHSACVFISCWILVKIC